VRTASWTDRLPLAPEPDPAPVPDPDFALEPEPAIPPQLFSFSRLKTFAQCPLRYRYRYLEGGREAFHSVESFLGKTVHAVLEWLYAERGRSRPPTTARVQQELARRWSESWTDDVAVVRLGESADASFRLAREMLARFHREVFLRDRSTTLALEQQVTVELSSEVTFTGFADRVGRTEGGRLFVVDYKTSRSTGDGADFSEGLQAPLYAACALGSHADADAVAGYHYLRHGTTSWHRVTRDQGRSLLARFLELAGQALATVDHPPKPGVLCAWCGFNHLCPAAEVPDHLAGGRDHARRLRG
jgi:putative RecB family exonuclease